MKLFLYPLTILLSVLAVGPTCRAEDTEHEYAIRMKQILIENSTTRSFEAFDNTRISFTVFGGTSFLNQPILMVPGRAESVFRYVELAQSFIERGYGPIFVIDHRGQGFSQRALMDHPEIEYVEDFGLYTQDLIRFLKIELKAYQRENKLPMAKPYIIAHSMGGAISNLSLLEDPTLTDKIAYISPMFDINSRSPLLNAFHDAPAKLIAEILCFAHCQDLNIGAHHTLSAEEQHTVRRQFVSLMERTFHLSMTGSSPFWIREAISATDEIRQRAAEHETVSLIFTASRDAVVGNQAIYDYSCQAKNCSVIELDGAHSLHLQTLRNVKILVTQIDHFFRQGRIWLPAKGDCNSLLKVKKLAN